VGAGAGGVVIAAVVDGVVEGVCSHNQYSIQSGDMVLSLPFQPWWWRLSLGSVPVSVDFLVNGRVRKLTVSAVDEVVVIGVYFC
jgi:hypothetical protein